MNRTCIKLKGDRYLVLNSNGLIIDEATRIKECIILVNSICENCKRK